MSKSPNIIFITHPFYAVNNKDNTYKLYFGKNKNGKDIIVDCKNKEEYQKQIQKYISGFYEYSRNEEKSNISMFDYFLGSKKEQSVMEKNKMKREKMAINSSGNYILDQDVSKMKNNWIKYVENSNVHICVLSFNNNYIDNNINIVQLQKKFASDILPKFFKKMGYINPQKNLEWVVALHSDTDNYHFHFAFIEKNKAYLTKSNKLTNRQQLLISEEEQNFLKREVALTIERDKYYKPLLINFNKELQEFSNYFNPRDKNFKLRNIDNIEIEEKILRLGYLLKQVRDTDKKYIKYNSLPKNEIGKEIRFLTKDIKKRLLDNDNLKSKEINIENSLKELNNYFVKLNDDNNIKEETNILDNSLIKNKLNKLDNYVLNTIVNHALYNFDKYSNIMGKENIELEDIILEYSKHKYNKEKNYNNKKKLRKSLLRNYFKNRGYKRKINSSIERAFFNLNKDQEKAIKQFYEMFENEYEKDR